MTVANGSGPDRSAPNGRDAALTSDASLPAELVEASSAAVKALDFSSYDLDGLRDDVRSIVDVSGAIAHVARWGFGASLLGAVASWLVFAPRIDSGFATFAFAAIAALLAGPAGAAIGGWVLARRRLDTVTSAAAQVVTMIGDIHRDVVEVRLGAADTSVQRVAVGILEEAVLPVVFGTVTEVAEGFLGPLGFLVRRVVAGPRALVERSVVSAVRALPDRRIGDVVGAAVDDARVGELTAGLHDDYARVRNNLTATVRRVSRASLTLGGGATFIALLPIALWWVIGFVVT